MPPSSLRRRARITRRAAISARCALACRILERPVNGRTLSSAGTASLSSPRRSMPDLSHDILRASSAAGRIDGVRARLRMVAATSFVVHLPPQPREAA